MNPENPLPSDIPRSTSPPEKTVPDPLMVTSDQIETLLGEMEKTLPNIADLMPEVDALRENVASARHPSAKIAQRANREAFTTMLSSSLGNLEDVELEVKIELGRTTLLLEDVVRLRRGSVIPLDRMVGEPVDILVNGCLVAHGELLTADGNYCVKIIEIVK